MKKEVEERRKEECGPNEIPSRGKILEKRFYVNKL